MLLSVESTLNGVSFFDLYSFIAPRFLNSVFKRLSKIWGSVYSGVCGEDSVAKMSSIGLTYQDISFAIKSYDNKKPVGVVSDQYSEFLIRLKDNITPIDDPLAKVISISGNTYDWNDKSGKTGKDVGVIAQELEEVLPEAVTTRKNGYLAVDYDRVVPLLVEAIKELNAKVDSLEQRLNN